jgi:extracellular factor (EF) 3-hydroxypalmitic acid methyl ester biosynthesis protein
VGNGLFISFEMNQATNSNGNGENGQQLRQLEKIAQSASEAEPSGVKESLVTFQTAEGLELRAAPVRVTRHAVVFELYNPDIVLRASEVLDEFKIVLHGRSIYSGRAVIRNFVDDGSTVTCEAKLDELHWMDVDLGAALKHNSQLAKDYNEFIKEWQKYYKVRPEYKLVLADMRSYFADLRLWVDQLELGIRSMPSGDRLKLEQEVTVELGEAAFPTFAALFEKFEGAAKGVEEDFLPAHQVFAKRQLHPLLLCSPFFYRCYSKPLGYAGDYEMVNMMMRNPCEGGSLFAKVMNLWFLQQPPVQAHRNRIDYLAEQLLKVVIRVASKGRTARVMSVGCGPAQEIQRFLAGHNLSAQAEFTLLDFNEETLQHVRFMMDDIRIQHRRSTPFHYVKKSVQTILKESGRAVNLPAELQYDFVYCAGLFDYLSDQVCERLTSILYDWVAPGGLFIGTNVTLGNPSRGWMEHVVDWHLIYRNTRQMAAHIPKSSLPDNARIVTEPTGVNIFLEVVKPEHA